MVNEQVFHFRIEAADADTGRGTVIVGIITAGIVRVGDSLDLHHAGATRAVSCHGVEFAGDLRRSRERPPLIGLLIPDLEPADVSAGGELTSPSMSD
jgi:translation elongation factor EF-Tu-like GTPase